MPGVFFKEFRSITMDWTIGAFTGATLDYCFDFLHSKSHILNVLSALTQFTCATFIVHEVLYSVGERHGTNTLQSTWILPFAVWHMSPNAQRKLKDAYYAFHRFLYGTRSLVPEIKPPEESKPDTK